MSQIAKSALQKSNKLFIFQSSQVN